MIYVTHSNKECDSDIFLKNIEKVFMLNITMGIPCHRRLDILKIQADYHKNVLRPFLAEHDINLTFFIVGTDESERNVLPIDGEIFVYEAHPQNILSLKFNRLLDYGKESGCDALMTMGSDDLIPPKLFLEMVRIALDNKFIASPTQMIMHDIHSKKAYVWKGYGPRRLLGLGAGRVYTKNLLNLLPPKPFGEGTVMNCEEGTIDPKIYKVIHASTKDLHKIKTSDKYLHDCQLLSLKASSALNKMYVFLNRDLVEEVILDIKDVSKFGWLTHHILDQILQLN